MEYALIETGGKQYKVQPGDFINIEKLEKQKGEKVTFDKVLFYAKNNEHIIGKPYLENVSVKGEVVEQFRDKKVIVFKYKPKKRYRKKQGHRQYYTRVKIEECSVA
ncbi:MAG TPA: 50S ribosomal protein L21 [Candidatus Eremiobacteraeota bacterium]|nr:MAG: 50S ribosomal protein L21 [bacterium ADurb.Bin363]HPZ08013.1 50S ribosomal protein L21 [Candidatus Eremiobacteraeota bacterium]